MRLVRDMFFEEVWRVSCGDFLDIEPSCDVLNCITEGNSCIITINEKYFWDIGLCECPSLLFCVKFEIFKCYFSRVYADTFPYWFFHRLNNFLCLGSRKIKCTLDIFRKTRHGRIVVIFEKKSNYCFLFCAIYTFSMFCNRNISTPPYLNFMKR